MRAWARTLAAGAVLLAVAGPALAQDAAARPIAGCKVAALNQQSRVMPDSDFYKRMDAVAAYWQGQLELVERDPAKRDALLAGAREALDKDLAQVSRTDGMMHVGSILAACRQEQERREVKP